MRLPDDRIYVAVLSNCANCADPRSLALTAATTLLGSPFDAQPAASIPPGVLDGYAGSYRDEDGDVWVVSREGDHLAVVAGRRYSAFPRSEDVFFFRDTVRTLRFLRDASGNVASMEIDEKAGPVMTAIKAP